MNPKFSIAKRLLLTGDITSAKKSYEDILNQAPKSKEALHGLGLCFFRENSFERAEAVLLQALSCHSNDPELRISLGIVYEKKGELEKAKNQFQLAIKAFKRQKSSETDVKYVNTLKRICQIDLIEGDFQRAKKIVHEILSIEPQDIEALKMQAQAFVGCQQYHLAIDSLQKMPLDKITLSALQCEVYLLKRDFRNALKCAKYFSHQKPWESVAYSLLSECYLKAKQINPALETLKRGLEIAPAHCKMLSRLLGLQVRVCDWEGRQETILSLKNGNCWQEIQPTIAILTGFSNRELQKITTERTKLIEDASSFQRKRLNFTFRRKREKKLKIGYLSSDFYNHVTAHLMLDVFGLHNREKFEVFTFSFGKKDRSLYRKRIIQDSDHFLEIDKMSDKQAAKTIYSANIDILVDLKGHIVDHRLGILTLRPSPLQVHYLGYPGTIGAKFIDYLIADHYVIPKSERKFYSESIVFMPHSYQVNMAEKVLQKRKPTKKEYGIPEEVFVFCCFNQNDKFDTESVTAWMTILQNVPRSVLFLWENTENLKEKMSNFGKQFGIDKKRFIICQTESNPKHLAKLPLADLFLDTFNYSAHTSCSDALRMGLPVLTCPGKTFASRVAAGLLKTVNVNSLIAKNRQDYIEKAIDLALDAKKIKCIQNKIKKNVKHSPLYNPRLFTQHLESAYEKMWQNYSEGFAPKDIDLR